MELPASFADYDLICDGHVTTCQQSTEDEQTSAKMLFLDTSHIPDDLGFVSPESFSEDPVKPPQSCTSSLVYTGSYPHQTTSVQSSLGSTESYAGLLSPYTHLHAPSPQLHTHPSMLDSFSFIPIGIEPVTSPEFQPARLQSNPNIAPNSKGTAKHQTHLRSATSSSVLQDPNVTSHLRELSSCFSPAAAQQQMSQLLDWESQATGSPSQSHDSTTPSCNSTNTHGNRNLNQMKRQGSLAGLHTSPLHLSLQPITPLQQHRLTVKCPGSSLNSFSPVRKPQAAEHHSQSPMLGLHTLDLDSKQGFPFNSRNSPNVFNNPLYTPDVTLDSPKLDLKGAAAFPVDAGHQISPSKNSLPAAVQPALVRPVRRTAAQRQIKYSDQLHSSSDSDASPSKASKVKKQKARGVQRPRRPNSKPARFCKDSESEEDLDTDGKLRRKHHNPWSMEETWALIRGVEECGGGKWADIKRRNYKAIEKRTAVDLKDKWRNLLRLAVTSAVTFGKGDRRRELPAELVDKVRLLHSLKVQQKAAAIRIKADLETLSRTSSRLKRSMHA